MAELAYREVYVMNKIEARRHLVQSYEKTGSYSQAARLWHTSRHVVRKWVRRYRELGEDGLQDQSRQPHHCPRQQALSEASAGAGWPTGPVGIGTQRPQKPVATVTLSHTSMAIQPTR